ncbi:MAG: hypothetical protein H7X97_08015, partial [Opitutaceae bacterium]|nr:hypothetical protein [Verrucomicrobiales bacterium]
VSSFQWAQLESEDYKVYIERLRAFGVPEAAIRDIIIADVAKLYRPKMAALRPAQSVRTNFWENRFANRNISANQTKEQREQLRALQKEQTDLVKSLLGEKVYEDMNAAAGGVDWMERQFGPMSPEVREKVSAMQQRYQEATSEIYAKANNHIDQDTQVDLRAARKKFRDELATVLTPQQLENYELRSSDTANNMRYQMQYFEPNEAEFRAIFKAKEAEAELNAARSNSGQRPSPDELKAMQQKQKEQDDALAAALGPDRMKEYKLADQYEFKNLLDGGVAKEVVFKVADMKTEVETASRLIRQDQSLTPDQRTAALRDIQRETEKSLNDLLGERRARHYSRSGGSWLRNLSPPSR